jgi:hypothetical protein
MTEWIELRGPESLAALLSVIAPDVDLSTGADVASFSPREGIAVSVQYDEVDADTWPYMVTIETTEDGLDDEQRRQTLAMCDRLRPMGWQFRAIDEDDLVIAEADARRYAAGHRYRA